MDVFNTALKNPQPPTKTSSPSEDQQQLSPRSESERGTRIKKNSRRKHRNSHLGCGTCKKRRIKCDESLPSCLNCMKGKLHCAYLNLNILARNALRMAQHNQHLRQERHNPDGEDNQPIVDQTKPVPMPPNDMKLMPHYQNGYAPYPLISTQQVINPYGFVVQQPVIQVPQIPQPPQVGQLPVQQAPGLGQISQVPMIYSMEVQQPPNSIQMQRPAPNGAYPLAPGLAFQMAQPYYHPSHQAPNTIYPPPPPPPPPAPHPQQHFYSQHSSSHHMSPHGLSPTNHTVDKLHTHPHSNPHIQSHSTPTLQQQQVAPSSSSSSSMHVENYPHHHKPIEGVEVHGQSTTSNSPYQHHQTILLQANKNPPVQPLSHTGIYSDTSKHHHHTTSVIRSLQPDANTLAQEPLVNKLNIEENKGGTSLGPNITHVTPPLVNAGNNDLKQSSTLPPLKREEPEVKQGKELRLPSISNLRSETETDKKPEILKLLS